MQLEQGKNSQALYSKESHSKRDFLRSPSYAVRRVLSAEADRLVAVHVAVYCRKDVAANCCKEYDNDYAAGADIGQL
jgi:hypothetical protein